MKEVIAAYANATDTMQEHLTGQQGMREILTKYGMKEMFWPMNAKPGREPERMGHLDKPGAFIYNADYAYELKVDGGRYTTVEGRFFSRHEQEIGKQGTGLPVEKTDQLFHMSALFEQFSGYWLDGEIYKPGGNSDDVTTILGCTPEKATERQKATGYLNYVIFDIVAVDYAPVISRPWEERRALLEAFFSKYEWQIALHNALGYGQIQLAKVYRTPEEKLWLHEWVLANKGEGIMAKNIHTLYKPGKRPEWHWYKCKRELEADVVVMGYTDGEGKFAGLIGSIAFGQYKNGKLTYCGACSGMDDDMRRQITENKEAYLGRVFRLGAMERTKAGMFRHPQFKGFRDDKNATKCIWGEYDA